MQTCTNTHALKTHQDYQKHIRTTENTLGLQKTTPGLPKTHQDYRKHTRTTKNTPGLHKTHTKTTKKTPGLQKTHQGYKKNRTTQNTPGLRDCCSFSNKEMCSSFSGSAMISTMLDGTSPLFPLSSPSKKPSSSTSDHP